MIDEKEKSRTILIVDDTPENMQVVELLSGAFELMEDRHGAHARAVSEAAGDAARKMNLAAESVAKVRLAGLMHDVGVYINYLE